MPIPIAGLNHNRNVMLCFAIVQQPKDEEIKTAMTANGISKIKCEAEEMRV